MTVGAHPTLDESREDDVAEPSRRWTPRRIAFWGLIAASLLFLALSPVDEVVDRVADDAPWIGAGLLITEALFIAGLVAMAASAGIKLGANPLKWRARLDGILAALDRTPLFWIGFAVNAVGAFGTGLVLAVAIIRGLPIGAWGLLVIPLADISLTLAVRAAVFSGVKSQAARSAQSPTNESASTEFPNEEQS